MEAMWNMSNRDVDLFLLNNEILSDVKFVFPNCRNEEIFGHTFFLSKKSPTFYTMFHGSLKEGSTVKIVDSSRISFLELVKFIYTEMVDLTPENVLEVMYLANKYLIKKLSEQCEKFVKNNISIENSLAILKESIYFKCELIEKECVDFIGKNTAQIMNHPNFLKTGKKTVKYLLALTMMNCDEITVFNLVIQWAQAFCNKNNKELSSVRDIFRLIRFPVMSGTDFGNCVKYSNLFTSDEIGEIFLYISTSSGNTNTETNCGKKCLDFETRKRTQVNQYSDEIVDICKHQVPGSRRNMGRCNNLFGNNGGYIQLTFLQNCILNKFALVEHCGKEGVLVVTIVTHPNNTTLFKGLVPIKKRICHFDEEIISFEKDKVYKIDFFVEGNNYSTELATTTYYSTTKKAIFSIAKSLNNIIKEMYFRVEQ